MRVSSISVFHSITQNLGRLQSDMYKANNMIASGKTINTLSDDPAGMMTVLDLRSNFANIEQLARNIAVGRTWVNMGESALSQTEDILIDAKGFCVSMASDNNGAQARSDAVAVADGYLNQILSLANTQVGGRYIFSGTKTDTAPFTLANDEVTYAGNDTPFSIKLGEDLDIAVGRDGETIFGDDDFDWTDPAVGHGNIFKTLVDLKTYLQNNDQSGIQGTLDKMDTHLSSIRSLISNTGGKIIRLDIKEKIIQDLNLNYTDRISRLEDADIAEAIIELESKELAYKAALSSSAQVMQLSLVDYL